MNKLYWDQIIAYLDRPDNILLKREIDKWVSLSEENRQFFEEILKIWDHSASLKELESLNLHAAETKFSYKLRQQDVPIAKSKSLVWIRAVAAVFLTVIIGYWIHTYFILPEYLIRSTQKQKATILLEDGSQIALQENTQIKYPRNFGKGVRKIFLLKGEASFTITKDDKHPFIIEVSTPTESTSGLSSTVQNVSSRIKLHVETSSKDLQKSTIDDKKSQVSKSTIGGVNFQLILLKPVDVDVGHWMKKSLA